MDRRQIGLILLWGGVAVLSATIATLWVMLGPSMGPLVPLFMLLAFAVPLLVHYQKDLAAWIVVAVYGAAGFLFGLSHGYVIYAWPLLVAGMLVTTVRRPTSPNPTPH